MYKIEVQSNLEVFGNPGPLYLTWININRRMNK